MSSVADDREGEAYDHARRGSQEDNQAHLASGVALGLAHQPTKDDARAHEPLVPHLSSSSLLNGRFFLILGPAGPPFDSGSSPHVSGVQKPQRIRRCYGYDFSDSIAGGSLGIKKK
jgi:hypothetical protein